MKHALTQAIKRLREEHNLHTSKFLVFQRHLPMPHGGAIPEGVDNTREERVHQFDLDGEALFDIFQDHEDENVVGLKWLTDKVDTTRPGTQEVWFYHSGEYNEGVEDEIRRLCYGSPQWHRQMAIKYEREPFTLAQEAKKHADRAVLWSKIAITAAVLSAILSVLSRVL